MVHTGIHTDRKRFIWMGHPSGIAWLVLTEQQGKHVFYRCAQCGLTRCFADFLRVADNGNDFCNNAYCTYCVPSEPWKPEFKYSKLAGCRISVLLPQGQVLGFWDSKEKDILRPQEFGIRRMKPDGNEFRLQPYLDRSHDKYGVAYGRYERAFR